MTFCTCLFRKHVISVISLFLFLLLLLLFLQSGELRNSQQAGKTEHTPDDPKGAVVDELPGELIRIIIEIL